MFKFIKPNLTSLRILFLAILATAGLGIGAANAAAASHAASSAPNNWQAGDGG